MYTTGSSIPRGKIKTKDLPLKCPKGRQYGNIVPGRIKMRLGAKSRIGLAAYGVVRSPSPSNPAKPDDCPLIPCRKPGIEFLEILDVEAGAEWRAVVSLWTENRCSQKKEGQHRC